MTQEFARDVEMQSPLHVTSQENLAHYIRKEWNTALMRDEGWGEPVCVLGAGIHDVAIPNVTADTLAKNVNFLLSTYYWECCHIIWVGNNAPLAEEAVEWPQTKSRMKEFDDMVRELVERNNTLREHMSFVDVHNASLDFPHKDNTHMINDWYQILGKELFVRVIFADYVNNDLRTTRITLEHELLELELRKAESPNLAAIIDRRIAQIKKDIEDITELEKA